MSKSNGPKVLFVDIETAPILAYCWKIWDENISLNQIKRDWHLLSWSAKWLGSNEVMYADQRKAVRLEDDAPLLAKIWKLLDEADIVVWQNGNNFDHKKLNARFILNGMQPPSSYKQIDTLMLARKHFGFTSNKLEYLSDKLNRKYKKQQHRKYPGFELWKECLAGNTSAWKEMEKYNKYDVLALEEIYHKLLPWGATPNHALWHDSDTPLCSCGSTQFQKVGFLYSPSGKFQRYRCSKCGAETRDKENMFSKEKRKSLRVSTTR